MEYSEKLKSPQWQKKRLEILNRDNWICQSCFNDEEQLHVHHMAYFKDKEPWDIDSKYLITLCTNCHAWEHENKSGKMQQLIALLREKAILSFGLSELIQLIENSASVNGRLTVVSELLKGFYEKQDNNEF